MSEACDIAVIGAGIAGASLAAALAPRARVLLIEAEDRPGYHSTGRSAAFWAESYGGPGVQPLTTASGPFLREHGFLSERGALTLARRGQAAELAAFIAKYRGLGVRVEELGRSELLERLPGLRAAWTCGALEPECSDIDVAGLHQWFLAAARKAGAELICRGRLARAEPQREGWRIVLEDGREIACGVLANAAGAWADEVAERCGVAPLGIAAYRRTVAQVRTDPPPPRDLPLVLDLGEAFYFKPEAGSLWLSPHDETLTTACDAAPEELDVAMAIDRFEQVVDWRVAWVEHKWAGLRSFAPDRLPVYGFDPAHRGFFWCAGQGGFGIQTAPAAADLAARLVLGDSPGAVDPAPFDPSRLR